MTNLPIATGASSLMLYGMSEELRDEHFNQKILEAYELKTRGKNQEALELYLNVLSQGFIKVRKNVSKLLM